MPTIAIVIGVVLVVALFVVAELLFSPGGAVLLTGGIGFFFGGPLGGGVGLVLGLVLALVTALLCAVLDPSPRNARSTADRSR